jgi:hypothetical protein
MTFYSYYCYNDPEPRTIQYVYTRILLPSFGIRFVKSNAIQEVPPKYVRIPVLVKSQYRVYSSKSSNS